MIRATFLEQDDGWAVTEIEAIPTWADLDPQIRLVDLPAALASNELPDARRERYEEAYDRISASLKTRGADSDGLVFR